MTYRDLENWMWADACVLIERAERLQRRFFQIGSLYGSRSVWEPPVDIFETRNEISICIALPGVLPEQVEIRLEPGLLRITGERPIPEAMRHAEIHRFEIPYGRFERSIELPPGRFRVSRQQIKNGCALIDLQK